MTADAGQTLWDRVPGSTRDSKWRNLFTYFAIVLSCLLLAELVGAAFGSAAIAQTAQGVTVVLLSLVYFAVVIVGVLFLVSTKHGVSPMRLARDGSVSLMFNVLAFSSFYRVTGIGLETPCPKFLATQPLDALYFSMVTVSTLGYGDFRPCEPTRLWAASQAILGNLHLAVLVAAAFLVANAHPSGRSQQVGNTRIQDIGGPGDESAGGDGHEDGVSKHIRPPVIVSVNDTGVTTSIINRVTKDH